MMISFGKTAITAIVVAGALLVSSPATARATSIRGLAAQEVRLATIAYRIAAANADACSTREAMTGLVMHDLTRYDHSLRPAISQAFSMSSGFGVLGIVPGSVAAEAGLMIDDEILALGPYSVEDSAAKDRPRSYQRMEQFHAAMDAALTHGRTELLIRRAGSLQRVPLRAQHGCGGKLALMSSSSTNAWADGKHVVITTGMTSLSRSEDEIAFVIAHEMAHNILGHPGESGGSRGIFGFSRVKRGEIEADNHAVRLLANAGYQPAGGITFLESARRRMWWNVSLDHPGFGRRIQIIAAAMKALQGERRSEISPAEKTLSEAVRLASTSNVERVPLQAKIDVTTAAASCPAVARTAAFGGFDRFNGGCER